MKSQINNGGPNPGCLDFGSKYIVDPTNGAVSVKKGQAIGGVKLWKQTSIDTDKEDYPIYL